MWEGEGICKHFYFYFLPESLANTPHSEHASRKSKLKDLCMVPVMRTEQNEVNSANRNDLAGCEYNAIEIKCCMLQINIDKQENILLTMHIKHLIFSDFFFSC